MRLSMLEFGRIEQHLVESLPELRPAVEAYWRDEGPPGEHPGQYLLFEGVFNPYITVLLDAASSPARDRLLRRAFAVVDVMLLAGRDVHDLAGIAVFEGQPPRWYELAEPFLGPRARAEIEEYGWSNTVDGPLNTGSDLYAVRPLVASLLLTSKADDAP